MGHRGRGPMQNTPGKMADEHGGAPPNKKWKETPTPPTSKPSLQRYCSEHGISLRRIIRANRQCLSQTSVPNVGRVYWNNFSPPQGFVNDVDDAFSQEHSQDDEMVSPAVLLTKSSDRRTQPKPRRPIIDPNFNMDEMIPLPTNSTGDSDRRAESTSTENIEGSDEFVDDDLSDSLICSMSQQAEDEYFGVGGLKLGDKTNEESEDSRNRELNKRPVSPVLFDVPVSDIDEDIKDNNNKYSTPLNPSSRRVRAPIASRQSVRRKLELVSPTVPTVNLDNANAGFDEMDDDMDSFLSGIELP